MQIAVIGAGIGGLAAATLLARAGHAVTLVERFAKPGPVGSGLVIQPVGLAVLDALGAGQDARAMGAPITAMLGHAGTRAVLNVAYRPGQPGLAMHRASLFHVLWQAALQTDVTRVTDATVTAAPLHGTQRRVTGPDLNLGPFDLVVDASGANSPLSGMQTRPLPYGAVWATVPWPHTDLPPDRLSQRYDAARRMAGVLPIGRLPHDPTPRAAVFWSLPRASLDHWPSRNMNDWRAEVAALWPAMAPFIEPLTDPSHLTPARYAHGALRRPYAPALVHIGDAAHRASPQLGQGANMALLDAMALAHALHMALDEALPRYAAMRRWHVRTYQLMSAAFTPMYQSDSRLLPVLRDHLLAPLATLPPVPRLLAALVTGDMLPPLASTRWP